jgi:hypothetical protein
MCVPPLRGARGGVCNCLCNATRGAATCSRVVAWPSRWAAMWPMPPPASRRSVPVGSASLDHRDDSRPDRRGQACPCRDHLSESSVCDCGSGRCGGHCRDLLCFTGLCWACCRIANPPSSVRLRPEPLSFSPLRFAANSGSREGLGLRGSPARYRCPCPHVGTGASWPNCRKMSRPAAKAGGRPCFGAVV